jgi:hypothetical protein
MFSCVFGWDYIYMQMESGRVVLAALVAAVIVAGSSVASAQTQATSSAQLQQVAASLQMYVDALPQMPKILGYGFDHQGRVVPVNLTVGMFQKEWVRIHQNIADECRQCRC